jgi:hypothetical protein
MDLQLWQGAVVMILIATVTAAFVTNGGQCAGFFGVLVVTVYAIFARTLYLLPPPGASTRVAAGPYAAWVTVPAATGTTTKKRLSTRPILPDKHKHRSR